MRVAAARPRRAAGGLAAFRRTGVRTRLAVAVVALALLLLAAGLTSLALGPVKISPGDVLSIVLDNAGLGSGGYARTDELVIEQLRLPRVVVGALVGMALGVSGTTMQGLFRNPMADPGIIGVSSGGAAAAVIAIAAGIANSFYLALPFFAFLGSLGAAFLVYGIAAVGGRFSMATLLLAGVAVSAFLGALVSAVIIIQSDAANVREILFWLAGGLDGRTWEHARLAAPLVLAGTGVILLLSRDLNLLMLGDEDARALGVRVEVIRPVLIAAAALATGAAVAFSGTVAFVGLVVPHILRLIVGQDQRVLVPASALGGAAFVVAADAIARTAVQPAELRLGVITAFAGAPFFLFLLVRNKRQAETF